ncbi:HD domain-containing protein [Azotobacter sp. CWF10]
MAQAAELARQEGADELVLAAFCHDVGHFCLPPAPHTSTAGLGRQGYERVGARWLAGLGFPERLCELVARHLDAKRYLCAREPHYWPHAASAGW